MLGDLGVTVNHNPTNTCHLAFLLGKPAFGLFSLIFHRMILDIIIPWYHYVLC